MAKLVVRIKIRAVSIDVKKVAIRALRLETRRYANTNARLAKRATSDIMHHTFELAMPYIPRHTLVMKFTGSGSGASVSSYAMSRLYLASSMAGSIFKARS